MKGKVYLFLASINGGAAVFLAHLIDLGIFNIISLITVAANLFAVACNILICAKMNLEDAE